mmetsp:Transcript_35343/g.94716  ORF Transcript_35343/g.94716 Transcript_35343/m.94716 type:complete len:99 (+) Transcript_35343:205-501(+)
MSRSALDRFEQKQAQMQAQHSMGYGAPMGIMPMGPGAAYGAVAPLGAVFQQQPQLTGQELEDLEEAPTRTFRLHVQHSTDWGGGWLIETAQRHSAVGQ